MKEEEGTLIRRLKVGATAQEKEERARWQQRLEDAAAERAAHPLLKVPPPTEEPQKLLEEMEKRTNRIITTLTQEIRQILLDHALERDRWELERERMARWKNGLGWAAFFTGFTLLCYWVGTKV